MTTVTQTAQALTEPQAGEHSRAVQALSVGDLAAARAIAQALHAAAPRSPDALQLLAVCHAEAGEHPAADECMRQALAVSPGQPLVLANRAALLRRAGRLAEAQAAWQAAVQASPGQAAYWRSLANVALANSDVDTALQAARQGTQLSPNDAGAWRSLGLALRAAGRWPRAAVAFVHALQLDPQDATNWIEAGVAARMMGRADRALACFERAAELGYAGRDLDHARVGAQIDLGSIEEARTGAERLARAHTDWPESHRTLAHLRWEFGEGAAEDEAAADPLRGFIAAAASRPQDRAMQWELARQLIEARRPEEALPLLQQLLSVEATPMLKVLLANAHQARGDQQSAARWYQDALAGFGDDAPTAVYNAWCRHLLATGRIEQAEHAAAQALARSPGDQEAWAYRGTAWRKLGDQRAQWLFDVEHLVGFMPVDLPPGYDSLGRFVSALRERVEPLHLARRAPIQQSVRGGSQTPGRLFGRDDPALAAAADALKQTAARWAASLPSDSHHPFLGRRQGELAFSGSWSVKLWSSGQHANHMHSEGWMSSAFYIALPPSVTAESVTQAGCIQFGAPPDELGLDLPPLRVIRPRQGWLALFPSYLWHGTLPFEDPEPRITAAFDLVSLPPL